jgi:small subunit ribosomal protein S27Ae
MATMKGGTAKDGKGKKPHKNKPTSKKYLFYKDGKTTHKHCSRCGPGVFLADHKDRLYCGTCGYTEFVRK